ncbi:MAG TPA: hypothetical protein VGC89_07120, partial [Pyrinomonadaceae bacterium]
RVRPHAQEGLWKASSLKEHARRQQVRAQPILSFENSCAPCRLSNLSLSDGCGDWRLYGDFF